MNIPVRFVTLFFFQIALNQNKTEKKCHTIGKTFPKSLQLNVFGKRAKSMPKEYTKNRKGNQNEWRAKKDRKEIWMGKNGKKSTNQAECIFVVFNTNFVLTGVFAKLMIFTTLYFVNTTISTQPPTNTHTHKDGLARVECRSFHDFFLYDFCTLKPWQISTYSFFSFKFVFVLHFVWSILVALTTCVRMVVCLFVHNASFTPTLCLSQFPHEK